MWLNSDRVRHQRAHALLDFLGQLVRAVHRPGVGHQQVERDEAPRARLAREQGVEFDAVALAVLGEDFLDLGALGLRDRRVEQPGKGAAHQHRADPDDVDRHRERDQRVEDQPAGRRDQRDARDDADRGPDIGHQVVAVGLQRDAVQALADRDQQQAAAEVDARGDAPRSRCRAAAPRSAAGRQGGARPRRRWRSRRTR